MIYAKLINNRLAYAPNPILHNGVRIGNPPAEVLEEEGYKPVRFTEPPTVEPGYRAVESWTETDNEIIQSWTVEEAELTPEEAFGVIFDE